MNVDVYTRRFRAELDPLALYRALSDGGRRDGSLLFETADAGVGRSGGRSFIVSQPALTLEVRGRQAVVFGDSGRVASALTSLTEELSQLAIVESTESEGGRVVMSLAEPARASAESERLRAPSAADLLRVFTSHFRPSRPDVDLRTFGAFAFDFVEHFEPLPSVDGDGADLRFVLPAETVTYNATTQAVQVTRFDFEGRGSFEEGRRLTRIEAIARSLGPGRTRSVTAVTPESTVDTSDAEFGGMVETARRAIVDGEVFQVVISRAFQTHCSDPLEAYAHLRAANPSPYMFFLAGESTLFGASPETSVRVEAEPGKVEIRPLAGTRGRGRRDGALDLELDARIEAELRMDDKEVAEHVMLVDLARNDVARVAKPGSRRVTRLLDIDRYETVMHLVSHVEGELRDDLDALHAYVSAMNMGTLTGAPKVRAAQILRGLEGRRRNWYGGAVGYLSQSGDFDTAIVIRSATVRDGVATVRAGAGIVYDSDPASEADETRRKAASVLRAVAAAQEVYRG